MEDMEDRGQTQDRQAMVRDILASVQKYDPSSASSPSCKWAATAKAAEGPQVVGGEFADQLLDFARNGAPNAVFKCPCGLSDWQKRRLHAWSSKSGLKSVSVGEGAARHLTITQPPVPKELESPAHLITVRCDTLNHSTRLDHHFTNSGPTTSKKIHLH